LARGVTTVPFLSGPTGETRELLFPGKNINFQKKMQIRKKMRNTALPRTRMHHACMHACTISQILCFPAHVSQQQSLDLFRNKVARIEEVLTHEEKEGATNTKLFRFSTPGLPDFHTQSGKNVPNNHKIYQKAIK
jgi:hypothetical protein